MIHAECSSGGIRGWSAAFCRIIQLRVNTIPLASISSRFWLSTGSSFALSMISINTLFCRSSSFCIVNVIPPFFLLY